MEFKLLILLLINITYVLSGKCPLKKFYLETKFVIVNYINYKHSIGVIKLTLNWVLISIFNYN